LQIASSLNSRILINLRKYRLTVELKKIYCGIAPAKCIGRAIFTNTIRDHLLTGKINMKTHPTTHKTNHREEAGEDLMEDAQALLSATAHVAEEKVIEARQRLSAAIERGKEAWHTIQDKAIAGAKATDQVIRDNPYKALGVAFGVGAIIGYLLRRRN
jgi:ElaB/YqjD/DUF883 family membrane-anchored ribosome-binding protein